MKGGSDANPNPVRGVGWATKRGMNMTSKVEHRSVEAGRQKAQRSRAIRRVIYLNEEEDATVRGLSAELGETFAGVVRALIFKTRYSKDGVMVQGAAGPRSVVVDSENLDAIGVEIKRIGVNANQAARALNGIAKACRNGNGNDAFDAQELDKMSTKLDAILSEFKVLNERFGSYLDYVKTWGGERESEYWNGYRDGVNGVHATDDEIVFDESAGYADEEF